LETPYPLVYKYFLPEKEMFRTAGSNLASNVPFPAARRHFGSNFASGIATFPTDYNCDIRCGANTVKPIQVDS
jgi:hypothetical protein